MLSVHFLRGDEKAVLLDLEGSAELLDSRTGSRQLFLAHIRTVTCSPAQNLFAFISTSGKVQFWNGTLTKHIKTFPQITDVFFPKGGTVVLLMSRNNKALILDHLTLKIQLQIDLPEEWLPEYGPILTSRAFGIVTRGDKEVYDRVWLFQ